LSDPPEKTWENKLTIQNEPEKEKNKGWRQKKRKEKGKKKKHWRPEISFYIFLFL